ncbi:MAG: hypothetical protein IT368_08495, partial [Candidatus Hydrogenedentes bacterium]|nr:hypothetical protein [Candidatus Hydrogenedentota bacterium]
MDDMSRWQVIHDAMQFFITPSALLGVTPGAALLVASHALRAAVESGVPGGQGALPT